MQVTWRSPLPWATAAAVVAMAWVLSASPFPAGGDPGHLLAFSHGLDGDGPEGSLRYAPLLPALLALLRLALPLAGVLLAMKGLAIALFLAQAWGLGLLCNTIAGPRAARWGYLLGLANPLWWYQVLWGGYPQFLALALGAIGLALLLRARALEGRARWTALGLAAAADAAVVAAHTYTALFFLVATGTLVALARTRRAWHDAVGLGAATAVLSLPFIAIYLRIARSVREAPAGTHWTAGLELWDAVQAHLLFTSVGVALWVAAQARAWRHGVARPAAMRHVHVAWAAGAAALLAVTPPLLSARALLMWMPAAVIDTAVLIAAVPVQDAKDASMAPASAGTRWVAFLAAALAATGFVDVAEDRAAYAPLQESSLTAMRSLPGDGRVLVASAWPNVDGWWIEAVTGRPALIGDLLKWYALASEVDRAVDARLLAQGPTVLDGGPLKVALRPDDSATLWLLDRTEFRPLAGLATLPPGAAPQGPFLPQVSEAPVGARVAAEWRSAAEGLAVDILADGPAARFVLTVPVGVRFVAAAAEDDKVTVTSEFTQERLVRALVLRSDLPFAASMVDGALVLDLHASAPLRATIHVAVHGIDAGPWTRIPQEALLARWDVDAVYARGPDRARFDADGRYALEGEAGTVPPALGALDVGQAGGRGHDLTGWHGAPVAPPAQLLGSDRVPAPPDEVHRALQPVRQVRTGRRARDDRHPFGKTRTGFRSAHRSRNPRPAMLLPGPWWR